MRILTELASFVGGSMFKELKDTVTQYFPPDLSPLQRAELENKMAEFLHQKELEANRILNDAAAQLDKRIAGQEGTAQDLKAVPLFGTLVLFLRGLQRPVWGFFAMWLDWHWFTASPTYSEQQQTALIVINVLVLGFLFGERTLKNLEPLIVKVFGGSREG